MESGKNFDRVQHFKYLGGVVTEDNEISREMKARIASGNTCYFAFQKLMRSSNASRKLKVVIYKTIRPVFLCGAETWTLTRRDKGRLLTWERKLLRKIYGAVNEKGQWRIRRNMELYHLHKDLDLVMEIKK
jgi:hypothetical protein